VASAADRSVSRPQTAAADATRYGHRHCYYGRPPPLLRLLLLPTVLLYNQFGDYKVMIIHLLGRNWKIRQRAIMDNVVTYVCATFGDDRL